MRNPPPADLPVQLRVGIVVTLYVRVIVNLLSGVRDDFAVFLQPWAIIHRTEVLQKRHSLQFPLSYVSPRLVASVQTLHGQVIL